MIGLQYVIMRHGLTLRGVACNLNITPQSVNDWLKTNRKIPKERLKQLSTMLLVDESLLTKKESEYTEFDRASVDYSVEYRNYSSKENLEPYIHNLSRKTMTTRVDQWLKDGGNMEKLSEFLKDN